MALQEEYRVSLEDFCGPLDLLLFLVRRAEVDIQAISIARIADQYLDHLRRLSEVDIDMAGDFLVMAATLMEIKSRVLAPGLPAEGEDQAESPEAPLALDRPDPGGELIRQLLAYQRLREAAEALEDRRLEFTRRHCRRPARAEESEPEAAAEDFELEDLHVLDLSQGYQRIAGPIDFSRLGDHRVEIDDTPTALFQEDLLDRLQHAPGGRLSLQEVFHGHGRTQRIGLFLAALELVRLRQVSVEQPDIDGPIELVMAGEEA